MDDNLSLPSSDRGIGGKSSSIESASKAVDSMSTEWTDEKHSSYLNSIEASFVNQLYNSECHSKDLLGWLSRAAKHTRSSGSDPKTLSCGHFKVLRRGLWENLKFERGKNEVDTENESCSLSENPWIQHFRSHPTGKETDVKFSDQMDDREMARQSTHLVSQRHEREATSSKQPSAFVSRLCQVSVGSITEVSDQNFVDMEVEGGKQLSRRGRKKRVRNAVSPITDQVVPFVGPTSNDNTAFLKENNEVCSSKKLETTAGFQQMHAETSLLKDEEGNDPELKGR